MHLFIVHEKVVTPSSELHWQASIKRFGQFCLQHLQNVQKVVMVVEIGSQLSFCNQVYPLSIF